MSGSNFAAPDDTGIITADGFQGVTSEYTESQAAAPASFPQGFTISNTAGPSDFSAVNGITAHANGGGTNATPLTADINRITVCATAADSVKLPPSVAGMRVTVHLSGAAAAAAQVWPSGSDLINGQASVPQPIGSTMLFECPIAGTWVAQIFNPAKGAYVTAANTTGFTSTAAQIVPSEDNVLNLTGTLGAGANIQLPAAAALLAAIPAPYIGLTRRLRVINTSSANFAWTLTTNTGLTLTGTMSVAQNAFRDFLLTFTSLSAVTVQAIGTGTTS